MTHPYSIYIWQPPLSSRGVGHWNEPVQCFTEQWAIYVAGLMHQDSRSVIKVVRYGLNIQCFPDEHVMRLEEALEQCTDPKNPIGNRVGDKEALIRFLPERNCYSLQECSPWIVGSDRLIGDCLTRGEVKSRIADVSFASAMDPNGWVVNPEKW